MIEEERPSSESIEDPREFGQDMLKLYAQMNAGLSDPVPPLDWDSPTVLTPSASDTQVSQTPEQLPNFSGTRLLVIGGTIVVVVAGAIAVLASK